MAHPSSNSKLIHRLGGRNLYLVGMMGCGKSFTGPILANQIDYRFVDTDSVIEELCGKSVAQIFEDDGEEDFRSIETQVLNSVGQRHSLVVATGGGVVTKTENWGVLHQGIVIWMDVIRETLLKRLQMDQAKRPLLATDEPAKVLQRLLAEREKFYIESDLHIKVESESPEEVALKICNELPSIFVSLRDEDVSHTTQC